MKLIKLTHKAKNDLFQAAKYTEERWGRNQRNIYVKQFDDIFHLLADNLSAGKACDHIKIGYSKVPQGSHIIFYKKNLTSKIEIIRILHKSMDVITKFMNN